MIRAILWKEWHEHRSKYLGYWFTLNAPLLLLALAIGLTSGARVPFADLSNPTILKYLPLTLLESLLVVSVFLILTGYLAVVTFGPEIEDRSLFFMYEQSLPRKQYVFIKLLYGIGHVALATCFSILLFPVGVYLMMLLSGKITVAGSSGFFFLILAIAGRAAVWCALVSIAAFTASALISALVPRWWLAALCSVILTIAAVGWGGDFFLLDMFPDVPGQESNSVTAGFGSGHAQWVTVARAFKPAEINAMAQWHVRPLLILAIFIVAFCVATALLYDRKELE